MFAINKQQQSADAAGLEMRRLNIKYAAVPVVLSSRCKRYEESVSGSSWRVGPDVALVFMTSLYTQSGLVDLVSLMTFFL